MKSLLLLALLAFLPASLSALTPEEEKAAQQRFQQQWDASVTETIRLYPDAANPQSALAKKAAEIQEVYAASKVPALQAIYNSSGSPLFFFQQAAAALKQKPAQPKIPKQAQAKAVTPLPPLQPFPVFAPIVQPTLLSESYQEQQTRLAAEQQQQAQQLALFEAQKQAADERAARIAAQQQAEADYQSLLAAQQAASSTPRHVPTPFHPLPAPDALASPSVAGTAKDGGFDLLNTVDFHFSPGGAWLHGSNGQTFHITHPAPGVTRLQP